MHRTQVNFEESQHEFLVEEARRQGVSMAELLRRLVAEHMAQALSEVDIFEELAGCGDSGGSAEEADDIAINHDDYLYRPPA